MVSPRDGQPTGGDLEVLTKGIRQLKDQAEGRQTSDTPVRYEVTQAGRPDRNPTAIPADRPKPFRRRPIDRRGSRHWSIASPRALPGPPTLRRSNASSSSLSLDRLFHRLLPASPSASIAVDWLRSPAGDPCCWLVASDGDAFHRAWHRSTPHGRRASSEAPQHRRRCTVACPETLPLPRLGHADRTRRSTPSLADPTIWQCDRARCRAAFCHPVTR